MQTHIEITLRCDVCGSREEITFKTESVPEGMTPSEKADHLWVSDYDGRITDGKHECYNCSWKTDHNYFSVSYGSHDGDLNIIGVVYRPIDFSQVIVLLDNESTAKTSKEYPKVTLKRIPKSLFETLKAAKLPELKVVRRVEIRHEKNWFKDKAEAPFEEKEGNIMAFGPSENGGAFNSRWVLDLGPAIAMFESGEIKQPSKWKMKLAG